MKTVDTSMDALSQPFSALIERGWVHHTVVATEAYAVVSELDRVANLLGTRVRGRAGALEEVLRPRTADDAYPRSLSAHYGLSAFPFHTELSHRPRPCRYLLLGCMAPGSPSAATLLVDWRTLGFSAKELDLLKSAPILVRTGRRSFYSTMLSPDHTFLRYDPGCLESVDERGKAALRVIERRLAAGLPVIHHWRSGDILIIDNWRVLHARGPSEPSSGRRLARILIDA